MAAGLLTDLYELTMMQAYYEHGLEGPAVFELFVRRLPPSRGFLLVAGLEQAVEYAVGLGFADRDLDWLARSGRFSRDFIDRLGSFRFRGEIHAIPEGRVAFPGEPLVQVAGPLPEAQLLETRLLNLVHFQTVVASKAARMVLAARGRPLIDFGLRRAHGEEAGVLGARAAYLAGFAGTSNVLAAARFDIPVFGTMAHSFIEAHDDERAAFEHFAGSFPDNAVLLIDTYDTEAGARKAADLARRGVPLRAVRIDSGDLGAHAARVRGILDQAGLSRVQILASGNLDEAAIAALVASGAPIDSFAPGTRLTTSADAPYLDCAYKLVEYAGRPRWKTSEGKATLPGRKQVCREVSAGGRLAGDVVALAGERGVPGEPLLQPVVAGCRRLHPAPPLAELRQAAAAELGRLPDHLRTLATAPPYRVGLSPEIERLRALTGAPPAMP